MSQEESLPEKPEGMTIEREERWNAIQLARIERRRRRAESRKRAQEWQALKRDITVKYEDRKTGRIVERQLFSITKSNRELRDMAWAHLIDGNPVVAAIINELVKRRKRMGKLYTLAKRYEDILFAMDHHDRWERARKSKKIAKFMRTIRDNQEIVDI